MSEQATFQGWAVIELLGHVRTAGLVSECQIAGAGFLRLDIPGEGTQTTQYVRPESIYRLTPVSEEVARGVARHNQPRPAYEWELTPVADVSVYLPEGTDFDVPAEDLPL